MSKHIEEPDDTDRSSETIDDSVVDIYEDVPEFDTAPWQNAVIEGIQDDDAEEV